MAKPRLFEQLDEAVQALLAGPGALEPSSDPRLDTLLDIARDLRDLPSQEFRARLKTDLARRASMTTTTNFARQGFHSITPYLIVTGAAGLIDFVKQAFAAEEVMRVPLPGGSIMHSEIRIGDSMLEMADSGEHYRAMPGSMHIYVNDADAVYQRALQAGATSLYQPTDQEYGDRDAGVTDPFGNQWYIGTPLGGKPVPEGLRAITPYLHPKGAPQLIEFLKHAFGAEEAARYESPDGTIVHAKIRIGDSVVEMGEAHDPFPAMPTAFHLYVPDTDAVYKNALQAGATSLSQPEDKSYGERAAGVTDPAGNMWFIATRIE